MAKNVGGLWEQQKMTLPDSQQGINRDLILTATQNTSASNLKELGKESWALDEKYNLVNTSWIPAL